MRHTPAPPEQPGQRNRDATPAVPTAAGTSPWSQHQGGTSLWCAGATPHEREDAAGAHSSTTDAQGLVKKGEDPGVGPGAGVRMQMAAAYAISSP